MQTTTNYGLKKIELPDSPPDITVMNPNWDTIDTVMAAMAMLFTNTSANDDYVITIPGISSQADLLGIPIKFKATVANTTACTLNVNGYGAKAICKDVSTALETGDIIANSVVMVVWDGTRYQLMESNGVVTKNGAQTLTNKTLTTPKLGSGGYIADANGNEILKTVANVPSAVNEVTVKNAVTGSSPGFDATGNDANIDIEIKGKGTGQLKTDKMTVGTRKTGSTAGVNSFASGVTNQASGDNSHAEGASAVAVGDQSHAEGNNSVAYGSTAHAEGYLSQAFSANSHTEGTYSLADTGMAYKIAAFNNTNKTITLDNISGLAIGNTLDIFLSVARSLYQIPITAINGLVVTLNTAETISASWKYAIKQDASGYPAHAEGIACLATGTASHAEGEATEALGGFGSHSEGRTTRAKGLGSHAEGNTTIAEGNYSHAEGMGTTASGGASHAEGYNCNAVGEYSHAEGNACGCMGVASHAGGQGSYSDGSRAFVHGLGLNAMGNEQAAFGRYNDPSLSDLFQVGAGTSNADRKNAMRVTSDGDIINGYGDSLHALNDNFTNKMVIIDKSVIVSTANTDIEDTVNYPIGFNANNCRAIVSLQGAGTTNSFSISKLQCSASSTSIVIKINATTAQTYILVIFLVKII